MDTHEQKYACFLAAKYEVARLARLGQLLSPEEAMCVAGHSKGLETLWSVAFRLGPEYEVEVDELNAYLEAQFPQHVKMRRHPDQNLSWYECTRHEV